MGRKREPWQKGVGIMYLLQKKSVYHPHTLRWKLETGRLPGKVEGQLMKEFKSRTIRDTFRDLGRAESYVGSFSKETPESMMKKGWLKKSDYPLAKRLSKYL